MEKKPPERLRSWDNFERELRVVIDSELKDGDGNLVKEAGEFPATTKLRIVGRNLLRAYYFHGGGKVVKVRMGYTFKPYKPRNYYKKWANFEKEVEEVIGSELKDGDGNVIKKAGEFPTHDQLEAAGRLDIVNALYSYYGSFREVKARMGYTFKPYKPRNYYKKWANFEKEVEEVIGSELKDGDGNVIKKAGEFPTNHQLRIAGKGGLVKGFYYNGGFPAVKTRMGYAPITTQEELNQFFEENKEAKELIAFSAVSKNGHISDAVEILAEKYPHRIQDASMVSRMVVESRVPLRYYLGPLKGWNGGRQRNYRRVLRSLAREFKGDERFDALVFDIVRDENMKGFNQDPRKTLKDLNKAVTSERNEYVKFMLERVHALYNEIFNLDIPGIGSLSENPRYRRRGK